MGGESDAWKNVLDEEHVNEKDTIQWDKENAIKKLKEDGFNFNPTDLSR